MHATMPRGRRRRRKKRMLRHFRGASDNSISDNSSFLMINLQRCHSVGSPEYGMMAMWHSESSICTHLIHQKRYLALERIPGAEGPPGKKEGRREGGQARAPASDSHDDQGIVGVCYLLQCLGKVCRWFDLTWSWSQKSICSGIPALVQQESR